MNTRSIGQPQFRSTKSILGPHSRAIASAAGTKVAGLFPASCTPKIPSEGCLRTRDHSSFDPARKEVANPTTTGQFSEWTGLQVRRVFDDSLSPHVISAPKDTHKRRNGCRIIVNDFKMPPRVTQGRNLRGYPRLSMVQGLCPVIPQKVWSLEPLNGTKPLTGLPAPMQAFLFCKPHGRIWRISLRQINIMTRYWRRRSLELGVR